MWWKRWRGLGENTIQKGTVGATNLSGRRGRRGGGNISSHHIGCGAGTTHPMRTPRQCGEETKGDRRRDCKEADMKDKGRVKEGWGLAVEEVLKNTEDLRELDIS